MYIKCFLCNHVFFNHEWRISGKSYEKQRKYSIVFSGNTEFREDNREKRKGNKNFKVPFLYFWFISCKKPDFFFPGKLKWPALASHFIKDIHIDITTVGKWVMGLVLSCCERHFSFCCVFCCFIFRIRCFSFSGFLYFFFIYCLCRKFPFIYLLWLRFSC